jgi:hypothetical protein
VTRGIYSAKVNPNFPRQGWELRVPYGALAQVAGETAQSTQPTTPISISFYVEKHSFGPCADFFFRVRANPTPTSMQPPPNSSATRPFRLLFPHSPSSVRYVELSRTSIYAGLYGITDSYPVILCNS